VSFFWCPEATIHERSRKDRVPYDQWVSQGFITATPGNVVDYRAIRETMRALSSQLSIAEVAFDAWNATQLATELQDDGGTMVKVGQGFASLSAPSKELEKLVKAGKLRHGGHPVL